MRVLIDTNIFIYREDDHVLPESLQELEKSLKVEGHEILIHPLSKREIQNDRNRERRRKAESKIETYPELSFAPHPRTSDVEFREVIPEAGNFNERVDNNLLFAVYEGIVDFLITEDKGIHQKALRLDIDDQVFSLEDGRTFFREEPDAVPSSRALNKVTVGELDVNDPIFDSLKEEYDFASWFERVSERPAYINRNPDGSIGAILILKPDEVENIGVEPPLGKKARLKICTLKVSETRWGSKTGELLIFISINESIQHELEEVYLTHFVDDEDFLVETIRRYGFKPESMNHKGESIFVKRLTPGPRDDPGPLETIHEFYPTFYDGLQVKKFVVPIQPVFHSRLFTSYPKRHPKLVDFQGEFFAEGNAIRKAYLTGANTRQIKPGDLLLFYRSQDHQAITTIGVCEEIKYGLTDPDEILKAVGRRSVFTENEIRKQAESPTTVILFWSHFDLEDPIDLSTLTENNVLKAAPQTVQQIEEEGYQFVKRQGGLDERFTLD